MKYFRFVVVIAFFLRAAFALRAGTDHAIAVDSRGYLMAAQEIITPGGPYSFHVDKTHYGVEITAMPGYPLFIAFLDRNIPLIIFMQAILGSLTCGLVYLTALRIWIDEKAALIAGMGLAVDPVTIMHGHFLLTEGLYTFLFVAAFALLINAIDPIDDRFAPMHQNRSLWSWIFAGFVFSLAAMVRPIAVFYAALATSVLAFFAFPLFQWRPLIYFLFASMLLPSMWMIRNHLNSNYTAFSEQTRLSPMAHVEEVKHPLTTARVMVIKTAKLFGGHGMEMAAWMLLHDPRYDARDWWKPRSPGIFTGTRTLIKRHPCLILGVIFNSLWLLALYHFALRGVWLAETSLVFLLISPIAYHVLLDISLTTCYYRQRLPIMPFLFILAGYGYTFRGEN